MAEEYWVNKVGEMSTQMQQARYMELARKISHMVILTKEELAELIALRECLQGTARRHQGERSTLAKGSA